MVYALIEHDPRIGLDVVKEVAAQPHGASTLRWLDASGQPDVAPGWVLGADGKLVPYIPAIEDARRFQALDLDGRCRAAITGGFTSSALGSAHSYGSSDTDQVNLDRAALAAITGGDGFTAKVKCAPAGGASAFAVHTGAQLHVAVSDMHAWIEGQRLKLDGLKAQVAAATTVGAVQAVVWG